MGADTDVKTNTTPPPASRLPRAQERRRDRDRLSWARDKTGPAQGWCRRPRDVKREDDGGVEGGKGDSWGEGAQTRRLRQAGSRNLRVQDLRLLIDLSLFRVNKQGWETHQSEQVWRASLPLPTGVSGRTGSHTGEPTPCRGEPVRGWIRDEQPQESRDEAEPSCWSSAETALARERGVGVEVVSR